MVVVVTNENLHHVIVLDKDDNILFVADVDTGATKKLLKNSVELKPLPAAAKKEFDKISYHSEYKVFAVGETVPAKIKAAKSEAEPAAKPEVKKASKKTASKKK